MATKSIYKNIIVRSKPQAWNLIDALEKAEKFSGGNPKTVVQKRFEELKGEQIKKFLGSDQ